MAGTILSIALAAYLGLCALLYVAQRSMLYFPTPPSRAPGAEQVDLPSNGEVLRVWASPRVADRALVYFGGNAEDVAGNYLAFSAVLPGHAIYLVNYRGYGGSTGSPTEEGLLADALAVHDHVRTRHAEVDVMGTSLGSGVAVYLAQQRPVRRLVLVAPYDSIARVAAGHYPVFPVSLLMKDRFDSLSRVSGIKAPTLAIVAERDEVIPRKRTDALLAAFPAPQLRTEVMPGANHNSIADSPRYLQLLQEFLEGP